VVQEENKVIGKEEIEDNADDMIDDERVMKDPLEPLSVEAQGKDQEEEEQDQEEEEQEEEEEEIQKEDEEEKEQEEEDEEDEQLGYYSSLTLTHAWAAYDEQHSSDKSEDAIHRVKRVLRRKACKLAFMLAQEEADAKARLEALARESEVRCLLSVLYAFMQIGIEELANEALQEAIEENAEKEAKLAYVAAMLRAGPVAGGELLGSMLPGEQVEFFHTVPVNERRPFLEALCPYERACLLAAMLPNEMEYFLGTFSESLFMKTIAALKAMSILHAYQGGSMQCKVILRLQLWRAAVDYAIAQLCETQKESDARYVT